MKAFFQRSLFIHYLLFFLGIGVVVYQNQSLISIGDPVHLLCALSFIAAYLTSQKLVHIFENSLLITVGFCVPLLIRNVMNFASGFSTDFILSGALSVGTTFLVSSLFALAGYGVAKALGTLKNPSYIRTSSR